MPQLRIYQLFISHAWRYSAGYVRLVRMLNKAPNFIYRNYSIPFYKGLRTKTNAQLESELYDQIRPAQIVIILAGMYVTYSKWIQMEIDIAQAFVKPILGIYPWGSRMTPRAVQEAADEMVGWNTSSIVNAVRRLSI